MTTAAFDWGPARNGPNMVFGSVKACDLSVSEGANRAPRPLKKSLTLVSVPRVSVIRVSLWLDLPELGRDLLGRATPEGSSAR